LLISSCQIQCSAAQPIKTQIAHSFAQADNEMK
jgi:hypothetical protein